MLVATGRVLDLVHDAVYVMGCRLLPSAITGERRTGGRWWISGEPTRCVEMQWESAAHHGAAQSIRTRYMLTRSDRPWQQAAEFAARLVYLEASVCCTPEPVAVLTLTIPDATLAELLAYSRRRGMALTDAAGHLIGFGLVREALADPAIDPDMSDVDAAAALGEAFVSVYTVAARDAFFHVARSPEAAAIGWQRLAVAICQYRGVATPPPTAEEAIALMNLSDGDTLDADAAAVLSGWLERRQREAEELAAITEDDARAAVAQAEEEVAAIRRKVRA